MLSCTPFLLVFWRKQGRAPSLAVHSRPRLGPEIHDITPASAPKATSSPMTFESHPTW